MLPNLFVGFEILNNLLIIKQISIIMNIIFVEKNNAIHSVFKAEGSLNYFHLDLTAKKQCTIRVKGLSPLRI